MGILERDQIIDQRFVVREFLGASAVGEKYRVEDRIRGQEIAIKLLYEDIVVDAGGWEGLRPHLNELTRLAVPGIARIFDYGFTDSGPYLSMEYVTSLPIKEWLKQQQRSERELHILFGSLAEILHAASQVGAHLGLKNNNLFVTEKGTPITTDFGLNRLVSVQKLRASATLTGDRAYLPPEVFLENNISPAAVDAFALGRLWLDAVKANTSTHSKTTRITEEWLPRLTHSNPPLRSTNFAELARVLKPKTRFPRMENKSPATYSKIGIVAILLLVLAIGLTKTRDSWLRSSNRTQVPAAIDQAQLAQQLHETEHQRMGLINDAHAIPHLFPIVFPHVSDSFLIDAAQRLDDFHKEQADASLTLQQGLRQYQQRLKILQQLLLPFNEVTKMVRVANQLLSAPLPLPNHHLIAWERELGEIKRALAQGNLTMALAETTSLQTQISQILTQHWHTAVTAAKVARKTWIESLEKRQLVLVEPGESLSTQLEELDTTDAITELPNRIEGAHQIQSKWEDWARAHEALPLPQGHHFVNSVDMRFVSTGSLLVSIWETRNMDFARHILETGLDRRYLWRERAAISGPTHPVVNITQMDATVFCEWLTNTERAQGGIGPKDTYRLPTDLEWSHMAGLFNEEGSDPDQRGGLSNQHVPWWPIDLVPESRGNYYTWPNEALPPDDAKQVDRFYTTAPVGSFRPNPAGIFDLGGNVWEWTSTPYTAGGDPSRHNINFTIRGAGWRTSADYEMKTNHRRGQQANSEIVGFRVVLEQSKGTDERP